MSLSDELGRLTATNSAAQAPGYSVPPSWQPSVTYDPTGRAEVVTLGAGQPGEESTWTEEVRALGVEVPPGWSVRLVEVRHDPAAWVRHGQGEDAVTESVTRRRYVVEPARNLLDVDELVAGIGKKRPKAVEPVADGWAYVHTLADWQIGKVSYGQGTDATVARILDALDQSLARLNRERRHRPVSTIVIAGLGDCIEGTSSQRGAVALAGSSDLSLTEQLRVVRRLMLEHVKAFAPLAERIVFTSVPGNHDEPHRLLGAHPRADDSFAVEAAIQVADALQLAGGFDHVETVTPDIDDLTITVEAAGSIIGLAHGHQTRVGKAHEWWAKLGHANHRIGTAHILLTGHYHHLRLHEEGHKLHVQAGSMDAGSPYFDQKHGGAPGHGGAVTFYTREGKWTGLEIL